MVKTLNPGDAAPDFDLPATSGSGKLADHLGKFVVVYFYPRDDTPGCTTEAKDFTSMKTEFDAANAVIIGISKDTLKKHEKFTEKHGLGIILASDAQDDDGTDGVCEAFGVWVEKKMYGKVYMGIERATFLIDPEGKIAEVWRKVKVKGHAEAVLERIKSA